MTVAELYSFCLNTLKNAGIDDYRFDCDCLFESFTGFDKVKRIINADSELQQEAVEKLISAVQKRADGEPLQYLLGHWNFMGLDFFVGKGVLIPRPETEMLVELACNFINIHKNAIVYDLCAGSGAIGLSVAKLKPSCKVFLFEKYDEAIKYLNKNAEFLQLSNVNIIKCDIFDNPDFNIPNPDLLLSNPPYIKSDDISALQTEVKFEPLTALDGGEDGLKFYRCIKDSWSKLVNENGAIMMECGDRQSDDIIKIFSDISKHSTVYYDFNNIDRVVEINV